MLICTCRFIPYWSCNGKNKLARHLLAMSVVCFYACNDTLNSVVDSTPFPPYVPFQGSSASKIVWMSARFVFLVCFGPRSGLRCGGILWSDNSFHVPSSRCVCTRVCLCAFCRCPLGRAQGVQTVAMGGRDPQWPLAQLEESHLPCEGAPIRPGSACCSLQWELPLGWGLTPS